MEEAIILNNNAILYLQLRNPFEACNLLTQASGLYLQLTDGGVGNQHQTQHKEHRIDWVNFSMSEWIVRNNSSRDDIEHRPIPLLYQSGLTVHANCCNHDYTDTCPCILSPVIWYNLGLTFQILGQELGASTEDGLFYLRRSNYLYEKVLTICNNGRKTRGLTTLLMAVLNNQACLQFEFGNLESFWVTLRSLRRRMNEIVSSEGPERNPEWCAFYANLTMLDSPEPCTAGAA